MYIYNIQSGHIILHFLHFWYGDTGTFRNSTNFENFSVTSFELVIVRAVSVDRDIDVSTIQSFWYITNSKFGSIDTIRPTGTLIRNWNRLWIYQLRKTSSDGPDRYIFIRTDRTHLW